MFEEPLLGGKSSKSASHEQHLQQYLYPSAGASKDDAPVDEQPMDLHVVIHQLNSFFAVLWPVCITMLCARYVHLHGVVCVSVSDFLANVWLSIVTNVATW